MKKFKIKKENTFKIIFHKDGIFHQHYFSNYWSNVYIFKEDKLTCLCGIELPSVFLLGYSQNFYVNCLQADEKCIGRKSYIGGKNIEGKIVDWVNGEFCND